MTKTGRKCCTSCALSSSFTRSLPSGCCPCLYLVMELVQLIKWSPKRTSLFGQLKTEMTPGTHDLRPLCPTRWMVRTGAIHAVIKNYSTLCKALEMRSVLLAEMNMR